MSDVVLIPLTRGKFATVDADDAYSLLAYSWFAAERGNTFYAARGLEGCKTVYMHRQILGLADKAHLVDHIDRDGLNNRKANFRLASMSLNKANSGPVKRNTSGFKGVHLDKERNLWVAQIVVARRHKFIGRFPTAEEAAVAYDEHAQKAWGEFAYLNQAHSAALSKNNCLRGMNAEGSAA